MNQVQLERVVFATPEHAPILKPITVVRNASNTVEPVVNGLAVNPPPGEGTCGGCGRSWWGAATESTA